jgi:hypothetical protein
VIPTLIICKPRRDDAWTNIGQNSYGKAPLGKPTSEKKLIFENFNWIHRMWKGLILPIKSLNVP